MKFAKYSWGYNNDDKEKYAIVQPLEDDCEEVKRILEEGFITDSAVRVNCHWAKMIYGTNAKYSKAGAILYFTNVKKITELDEDEVMNENFVGLI